MNSLNGKQKYDYLIVGAGLFGAVFCRQAIDRGKRVLVVEKRCHIGGNIYTELYGDIHVHKYGAHIFHTNNEKVWQYITRFAQFNDFVNMPAANYRGEIFSLPFNMNTFRQMWGVSTAEEAAAIIAGQRSLATESPRNLEEQALSLVGRDVFEKLIKGYTEKQWGRKCSELPASVIKRLPVRFTFDNNYYNAAHQGIPVGGYTAMIEKLLDGADIITGTDYLTQREQLDGLAETVLYTGPIDEYYHYCLGHLEYRSLLFEFDFLHIPDYQGNAVVNYTDAETPWTRIIEHKWFTFGRNDAGFDIPYTIISREYPQPWTPEREPFYPVNDEKNNALYKAYKALADKEKNVYFGGRLGEYKYLDMDQVIAEALELSERLLECQ